MFRRRVPKKTGHLLQDLVWPRIGWGRVSRYWFHRIFHGNDSTYKITAGLASGAAVSFSPFVGTHIIQSFILARILKANWIAALAGTLWGNPWTFPFLWAASYMTGAWMVGISGTSTIKILPDYLDFEYFIDQPKDFFAYLFGHPLELLLPMTLGSLLVGIVFWLFAYGLLYYPVLYARKVYDAHRQELREKLKNLKEKIRK
jgi:hypothetical protein